jgi:putative glutamine amidotransferase
MIRQKRPTIGLSSCIFHEDPLRPIFKGKALIYAEEKMVHWISDRDALVFLLPRPSKLGPQITDYIDQIDGLVLQGGVDVAPESYNETPIKPVWAGDLVRDEYEIALIKEAHRQTKPILGICRGHQILNVAFGGTMFQDIEHQNTGAFEHRNWDKYEDNKHKCQIIPHTGLAKLFPHQSEVSINSIHHQAIKDVAKGFKVEAISSSDKIIEAIRYEGPEYMVGVQWHPEFQRDKEDSELLGHQAIIQEFIDACKEK